jgi:hypothetical protein
MVLWPFGPDLVASDIHIFEPLKKHLTAKQFSTDANVKQVVTWLHTLDSNFFYARIRG